jgi:hypothetical protein
METLRYLNKNDNWNERQYISDLWKEQIEIYGQETDFYSNLATLEDLDVLYGENQSKGFSNPKKLLVQIVLNNDAFMLSKFGIVADADLNGVIHPDHFTILFGLSSEPKAGDLIKLTEYGIDRLNYPKRGPTVYELSEVRDEFEINALGGHYVWFFKAKRYDYSYEPNSPGAGQGNNPIDDNDKIEETSKENFDYDLENPCSDDSVYGDY